MASRRSRSASVFVLLYISSFSHLKSARLSLKTCLKGSNVLEDMFLPWRLSSYVHTFGLFLIVIYFVSDARSVKASPIYSSYPSDDEIRQAFLGVGPDETTLISELRMSPAELATFKSRYAPKKTFFDVFPVSLLTYHEDEKAECYSDFLGRCSRIFAEESSGDVYLFADWTYGPHNHDSQFNSIIFPTLRNNPNVRRIMLVNPSAFAERLQFWPPKSDDPHEIAPEDEAALDVLTIGAGVATGGLSLFRPILGSPTPSIPPPQKKEQVPVETKQDSFFVDTASLPEQSEGFDSTQLISSDALPLSEDQTPLFTTISDYGTDVFAAEGGANEADTDAIDSATITGIEPDSLFSTNLDDTTDLFGAIVKRKSMLYRRGCAPPPGLELELPFLAEELRAAGAIDSVSSVPFPGALPAYATVHVVQRRSSGTSGQFKLDIEIRNSADEVIGSIADAVADENQRIEVQSALPYRVQVWTQGSDDYQPLKFQYGPTGVEWDSNDSDLATHDCHADEWREDHREIDCKFNF